jgi:eukaryotic-like serine/threonine-protein kinase
VTEPERLGKYVIREVLGKGAMGVVYKGFDPMIERDVAIKTIRKDLVDPELAAQYMARFRNEAKAAGRLHHPHIVGVYEYGEVDEVTFIAMEYVQGSGLRAYLNARASFDFAQLVDLMTQLLDALAFAHDRGVVHRDIKPSNLIVTNAGLLKVADFGVARIDTSDLTVAGMVIGTPSYMSPEQCRGLGVDARSDLFSAGVVLYELLTGTKPFRGTLQTISHQICYEEPAPPSQISTLKFPEAIDRLVGTAMCKDPAGRYQTARAFNDALRETAQISVEVDNGVGSTRVNIGTLLLQRPQSDWDEDTLRTAEQELARAVGPMARVIVARAAARTRDRAELCSILSDNIDDPESRRQFVVAFNKSSSSIRSTNAGSAGSARATHLHSAGGRGTAASGAPETLHRTGSLSGVPVDQAFLDQVAAQLAVYLGPIAQIMTRKAARDAKGRGDLVRRLAEHLGTQDRAAFLRDVGFGEG